jgi:hypothetical protein
MTTNPEEADPSTEPWRFRGLKGPILIAPCLTILTIESVEIAEEDVRGNNRAATILSPGSKITMRFYADGNVAVSVTVLDLPEQVAEQAAARNGWYGS